jgi:PAS domain-containing protein
MDRESNVEALMNPRPHQRSKTFLPRAFDSETDSKARLRKSVDVKAQSLLEAVPDAILMVNRAGKIVFANVQAESSSDMAASGENHLSQISGTKSM